MNSYLYRILNIILLLSAPVAGDELKEPVSFNRSLILYNEATENLDNVTQTISDLNANLEENTKLKNEVFFHNLANMKTGFITGTNTLQAVAVWVSWMLANSLCEGDLNMTGADTLWRQSRYSHCREIEG